jgi:hypothetical protein
MRITYDMYAGKFADVQFDKIDSIIDLRSEEYKDVDVEWAKSLARIKDTYEHKPTRVVDIRGKTVFWVKEGVEFEKLNKEWVLVRGFVGGCAIVLKRDTLSDSYVYGYDYTVEQD